MSEMRKETDSSIEQLVDNLRGSAKYKNIDIDLIRQIGTSELVKHPRLKDAIKSTKSKLHQIAGAYQGTNMHYRQWSAQLHAACATSDHAVLLDTCRKIMEFHSSTRERLPILDQFYSKTLSSLPPIRSILDVACGLNPLAIPWMPLAPQASYYACDIYEDMIAFLSGFFTLLPISGRAEVCNVISAPPGDRVDLALVLKTIPCLEQVDKTAGVRLLDALNASRILVSFPVHSLGGRDKQMAANYEARFRELMAHRPWEVQRFQFATELAFLITKPELVDERPDLRRMAQA